MGIHYVYALVEGTDIRYVGYSIDIKRRQREHSHSYPNWHMVTLGVYPILRTMKEHEKWWIKRLREAGYLLINENNGGGGPLEVSILTRTRMSASHTGKKHTTETRAKISKIRKEMQYRHSAETRAKMSQMRKGNKNCLGNHRSNETRARISAGMIGKQNRLGKRHSLETRHKISAALNVRWATKKLALNTKYAVETSSEGN